MKTVINLLKKFSFSQYSLKIILGKSNLFSGKDLILTNNIQKVEIDANILNISNKEIEKISQYHSNNNNQRTIYYTKYLNPYNFNLFQNRFLGINNVLYRQFSNMIHKKNGAYMYCGGDFEKLITKSSIYIDKSLFIKEIIEANQEVTLITMPRRWGKSLNLDMLRRFLCIEVDSEGNTIPKILTENYKFFNGGIIFQSNDKLKSKEIPQSKLIANHPEYLSYIGKYPVIFIDFKNTKVNNYKQMKIKIKEEMIKTLRNFEYLSKINSPYFETTFSQEYSRLLRNAKSGNITSIIENLSSLLYKYHNEKVWILIDEYDAAANEALLNFKDEEKAKLVLKLFREIFEPALKGNINLERSVLTGVQYIVQSGMLSGLNNLKKYNVSNPKYSKYYGIDTEELNPLLDHFKIDNNRRSKLKDWYNGYLLNCGTDENPFFIEKYNIWSIVNYFDDQPSGFISYWTKTGYAKEFINVLLKYDSSKKTLENLVKGQSIKILSLKLDFDISDFNVLNGIVRNLSNIQVNDVAFDLIYSYLYITGYLTKNELGDFKIPNKEIQYEMKKILVDYYIILFNKFNIPIISQVYLSHLLYKVLNEEDVYKIPSIFTDEFCPKFEEIIRNLNILNKENYNQSEKGLYGNEKLIQSILNYITLQLEDAVFATELHTEKIDKKRGIADIHFKNKDKGIIIETKYNMKQKKCTDTNKLKNSAENALKQAKEYKKIIENLPIQIFIGFNVTDEKELFLDGEIMKGNECLSFEYPLNK